MAPVLQSGWLHDAGRTRGNERGRVGSAPPVDRGIQASGRSDRKVLVRSLTRDASFFAGNRSDENHSRARAMAPAMICSVTPSTQPIMIIVVQAMCGLERNTITQTDANAVKAARKVPTALRNSAESTLPPRPLLERASSE